jgi:hypothetical protein
MEQTIEIHPYDFAELISGPLNGAQIDSFKTRERDVIEFDGKLYHRNPLTPRTEGPHTIV